MSPAPPDHARPDYGIDAPGVVRNLLVAALGGAALWGTAAAGGWSGRLVAPLGDVQLIFPLASAGGFTALGCGFMATWMLWSSKVGKIREREKLLDHLVWTGGERVLDVGCGRGLLLIGAAKRLTSGRATGIDIWQQEDLSGNHAGATHRNAAGEGVADRIELTTADMRTLPFAAATFDVVVSKAAIHNIYSPEGRAQAVAEIARVLKPGGHALIDDIRHGREYATTFAAHGCPDIRRVDSPIVSAFLLLLTFGSLRPSILLVKKPA